MNTKMFWSEKKLLFGRITDHFCMQIPLFLTFLAISLISISENYSFQFYDLHIVIDIRILQSLHKSHH